MIIVIINILDLILHCFEKGYLHEIAAIFCAHDPWRWSYPVSSPPNAFAEESEQDTETMIVRSTAEEALKQQPGVSIITAEDIAKQSPVNDLSDIIRKMPGVNLDRQQRQRQSGATTARLISAAWGRRTP